MVASHLSTDLTDIIQDMYMRTPLLERDFRLNVMDDAKPDSIREGKIVRWFRWNKFALAEAITEGTDLSTGETAGTTQIVGQLREFGQYISISPFGDAVRFVELAAEALPKFREQATRTAWANYLRPAIVVGDTAAIFDGSESFNGCTIEYAGADSFAGLTEGGSKISSDVLHKAKGILRRKGATPFADGNFRCSLSPWEEELLFTDDSKFRELFAGTNLSPFRSGDFPQWAGCSIAPNDMPFREALGGTEGTFVSNGNVITTLVYGREAFGATKFSGKGGLPPSFKIQDISKVGVELTIGYKAWLAAANLNPDYCVAIKSVVPGPIANETSL